MTLEQIQALSDDEIRVRVAEACGWTKQREIEPGYWVWIAPDGNTVGQSTLPNYPADLNACAGFVDLFDYDQAEWFEDALCDICKRENDERDAPWPWRFAVSNASARARCEAFLAVMQQEKP